MFRRRRYNELSESIREHLDEKIADLMNHGMSQEEAERIKHADRVLQGMAGWELPQPDDTKAKAVT
ncbi:MAG: permease prefix domain 1-containing protein [Bryobacteraceae bacterium]